VLVNPAARAHDGDAVVARVNDQVMVRLLAHRGAELVLTPLAPDLREFVLGPMDDFAIAGTVAAVMRPLLDKQESGSGNQESGNE